MKGLSTTVFFLLAPCFACKCCAIYFGKWRQTCSILMCAIDLRAYTLDNLNRVLCLYVFSLCVRTGMTVCLRVDHQHLMREMGGK